MAKPIERTLTVELPSHNAVVDFLGNKDECGVTVKIELKDGKLWVCATAATQAAEILIDEVVDMPDPDAEDEEDEDGDNGDA